MSGRVLLDHVFDIVRPQSFLKPLLVQEELHDPAKQSLSLLLHVFFYVITFVFFQPEVSDARFPVDIMASD